MHAYNCICANVPAQIACTTALNEGINAPLYMNRDYIERRNYLKEKLESLGFELTAQPEGAFYIFPSIKRFTENDFEFCVDVLEKAHLAMVLVLPSPILAKGIFEFHMLMIWKH